LARDLTEEQTMRLLDTIVAYYKANAGSHRRLGALIEKIGMDEFKKAVLAESP
jgi:dissimilatory sulfite reductase (desulfoviridin) alpha/beta subunit